MIRNVGDKIAIPAKFIARTLDDLFETDLENCGKCKQMQTNLNNAHNVWDFVDAVRDRFRQTEETPKTEGK